MWDPPARAKAVKSWRPIMPARAGRNRSTSREGGAATTRSASKGEITRARRSRYRYSLAVFDHLESMAGIGGLLVNFASSFDRPFQSPEPEPEDEGGITWWDIRRQGVGERALALVKRPRERLILLLAIHLHMSPAEINKLNLAQVTEKFGRDYRARVYLKKRLVRKKAVAEALLQYRKRDRESFWDSKDPMFRTGKRTPAGRSMRMGAKAIEALLVRYAERALKTMPAVPETKEPPTRPERPPMFWIANVAYHRTAGN